MTMLLDPAKDIKIGTSGYSYAGRPPKGWYGAFYPEKKTKGFDELEYYSQIFNTCEINNTFYRPPSATVTKAWATNSNDTSAVWAMAIASSGAPASSHRVRFPGSCSRWLEIKRGPPTALG
jgi:hypothetical protein